MRHIRFKFIFLSVVFVEMFFVLPKFASAATNVYYSVGQNNTVDYKTGTPNVTITSGVATFTVPQTARNIGVGDVIVAGGTSYYISGKITQSKWRVVTALGAIPSPDVASTALTSWKHVFGSLNAAVGGTTPGAKALLGNTVDLDTNNWILNIPLYYDTGPDTTAVSISAFTTASDNYLRIYTPTNTSTEVNQSQRHSGKWDNKKYVLYSSTDWTPSLTISSNDVKIDGLQITKKSTFTNIAGISYTGVGGVEISNNIIKSISNGVVLAPTGETINKIWNNIIYNFNAGSNSGIYHYNASDLGTFVVYNNTVYNTTGNIGIYFQNATSLILKNNLVQNGATAMTLNYSILSNGSQTTSNNVSEDVTSPDVAYQSRTVKFVNEAQKDFHLMSTDTGARGFGANLFFDANIPVTTDIDGQSRPSTVSKVTFDIGADQTQKKTAVISRPNSSLSAVNYGTATPVYYSVGQNNTVDYKTGTPNVTITSGVATFTVPQTARNIGVGDVIVVGGTSYYISGKITQSKWRVVTALGAIPSPDVSSTALTSWKHVFGSLNAAVGGATPGVKTLLGNTVDLDTNNWVLNIPLYYDTGPDTTAVTISAFTTASDNYLRIYTPTNTSTEVNQSQRHSGKWDNTKWRMEITNTAGTAINNYEDMIIDGLQISIIESTPGSFTNAILQRNAVSIFTVSNNIIKAVITDATVAVRGVYMLDGGTAAKVYNNLIYNLGGSTNTRGIRLDAGTVYAYNNTIYNSIYGFVKVAGTFIAKNNLSYANTSGDYSGTFDSSSTGNLSKDATAPAYNAYYRSATVKFVNEAKKDFHLLSTDTGARGFGANLTADANLPFSTDIDGQNRPAANSAQTWSIGADEVEAKSKVISRPNSALPATPAGVTNVYFSVGQNNAVDYKTGTPNVTITSGVATFTVPQTKRNIGVGDVIVVGGTSYYISGKITQSKWRVVTALGATPSNLSSTALTSWKHVFGSLSAAIGGATPGAKALLGNTTDLDANNWVLNIPLYYDTGPDTTAVSISAFTTASDNYLRIYTPTNTSTEVNQSQRHIGKWDTGKYRLEIESTSGNEHFDINESYIQIDGLQMKLSVNGAVNHKMIYINVNDVSSNIKISNNVIKTGTMTGSPSSVWAIGGAGASSYNIYVWNNIIYDFTTSSAGYALYLTVNATYIKNAYVYGNTIINSYYGLYSGGAGTAIIYAKNNIIKGSGDSNAYVGTFSGSDYNATDGTDAGDGGANSRRSQSFKFVNASAKDFHLMSTDAGARGFGANLYYDANIQVPTDIDGQNRPKSGPFDIGADQKLAPIKIKR